MGIINAPLTVWNPASGNGEAVSVGVADVIDELANFLVDETGNFIADTGTDFLNTPLTTWVQNDGV